MKPIALHRFQTVSVSAVLLSLLCSATMAFGQLQWSSYDSSGNLLNANVATGGDVASSSSVTFTIPANTQMFFVTRNFTPIVLSSATASAVVTFQFSASGGVTGVAQRVAEWGLYNSGGTATLADDIGMFGGWQGSYVEGLFHAAGSANLFSGTSPGLGKTTTGAPTDGTIYTNQIRLYLKTAPVGVALGSSSSTLGTAGIAMNGVNLVARGYTNPANGTNTFDEFGFMFNNTTASPITVTLSAVSLGNSMTWDASGANPSVPTDGSGIWSSTNANWSDGPGGAIGASDSVWSPGYSAVIGANNGAAGTITITEPAGVTVSNITFNPPGSGGYTITASNGSPLTLVGNPTITVASGVAATNSAQLAGTAFTKGGSGTLALNQPVNNTYTGLTVINNGRLNAAGSDSIVYIPGDLLVNPNGMFAYANAGSGGPILPSATLIVNGGTVDNYVNQKNFYINNVVLANNGLLEDQTGNSYLNATNIDARSGSILYSRYRGAINFVKSTAGTVLAIYRPNSSGSDGNIVTLSGGSLIFQKDLNAANRLKTGSPLTLGGGTLMFTNGASGISPNTESPSGTSMNPGASTLIDANAGTSGGNISLGALNRSVGSTLDFYQSGPGSVTTANTNNNGILGGWATYAGADWLVGTTFAAYSGYQTSTDPTTWAATDNVSLSGDPSSNVPDLTTINTLKLSGASTVTLNGGLTLAGGGLLVTGSGANAIASGSLLGASGQDLVVIQNSTGDLTISSALADNGGATALTKSGPGKLIIAGTDAMTGNNYLNGGAVEVSDLAELAAGPLVMNGGTLRYTGTAAVDARTVTVNGAGGTFDVNDSVTLTQSGAISGSGAAMGDLGGLTKNGNGTMVLTASNSYNGPTIVNAGTLLVDGTNSFNANIFGADTVTVYGTLGGSGLISGVVDIKSGGILSPGDTVGTLTLGSDLTLESGSTNLFDVANSPGTSDQLVVKGNLIVSNSTLAINVPGSALQPGTNTLIQYTGALIGSFNSTVALVGGTINCSLTVDTSTPGQVNLVLVPQVAITSQPQDLIVSTNAPATFTVGATGTAPIGYQWFSYGDSTNNAPVPLNDATNATFTITNAQPTDTGLYAVVVSNSYNSVMSRFASLIVGNVAPVLNGPFDQTVIQGNDATFSANVVIANPQPTFQWQTNGVDVAGATSTSLTLTNVQYDLNGTTVSLIASNAAAMVTNNATLTVIVRPVITPQPTSITVNVGDTAVFTSGATGVPTPLLQWYKNGAALSNQTNSTLTIGNAQGSDIAGYMLVAANAAGSVTSSVARLTVDSTTLSATAFGPTNGATGICYDTPLYVTFNGPVSIVNSGQIRIYDSTNSATPVDTIDMSSNTVVISPTILVTNNIQAHSLFSGDSQVINYFPVIITGNTAAIYPHSGVLTSNQTYYVTMGSGIVADSSTGAYFAGISDTNAWRFTTKPTGPANPTNLVVATDNSGDFDTVQGAVDSVPPGNSTPTLINIQNGNYVEIVDISGKNNLTFLGQSRTGTVVGYPNNNNLTPTTAARMAFKVNSSDITLENLTITNGTPQGGSQAEALLVYNNGLHCIVNNCDIKSRQDTILINATASQCYLHNCYIVGNFDYIWGSGVGYFDHCSFNTLTNTLSSSYNLTAARTGTSSALSATTPWVNPNGTTYSAYGFTFVNCTFDADTGVSGITLAGSNGTAGGLDSWIDCLFSPAYVTPPLALSNSYVFWQYQNTALDGSTPVSFANVQTIGVTNNDPRLLAATNIVTWFSGWAPQSAPTITGQPTDETVGAGQPANLTVSATGVPDPTYQWFKDTTNLVGQTGSTLMIGSASGLDIGTYYVIVSNGAGSVTSSNAVLTVNPPTTPSTIASPSVDNSGNVQFTFTGAPGSAGFGYRVWATTNLSLTPVTGTWTLLTNGVFDTGPVVFTDPAGALPQRFYLITVP
jgi:autotransporter-associated beta strand protein